MGVALITAEQQEIKTIQNGFNRHKIYHVSASNVNRFRESPDSWVASYLYHLRFPAGYAAIQGSSVEWGVDYGIYNQASIDECQDRAVAEFIKRSKMMKDQYDEIEKRTPIIKQMVQTALEQLLPYGKPVAPSLGQRQHQIEIPVRFRPGAGGTITTKGFLDYWFEDEGIVDLKTTATAPSRFSTSHGVQAAIYQRAMKKKTGKLMPVRFLYCLKRKKDPFVWLTLEEEDAEYYLNLFKRTVISMEKMLNKFQTKEEMLECVPHNPDSFYWNEAAHIAAELYG